MQWKDADKVEVFKKWGDKVDEVVQSCPPEELRGLLSALTQHVVAGLAKYHDLPITSANDVRRCIVAVHSSVVGTLGTPEQGNEIAAKMSKSLQAYVNDPLNRGK